MKWFIYLIFLLAFQASTIAQESKSLEDRIEDLGKAFKYKEIAEILEKEKVLSIHLQITLADAQYKSGQLYHALQSYEKLYESDSNLSHLLQQARIYEKIQDNHQALENYLIVAKTAEDNPYFWKLVGKRAESSSEFDLALNAYAASYDLQPNDIEVIGEFASLLMKVEQYNRADSLLQIGIENNPSAFFLKRQRLMSLYNLKKNKELVGIAEELFLKGDSSLISQKLAGISNYHEKNYEKSISLLTNVTKVDKESDLLYYYLGLAYRESGDLEKASELIEKSIDLSVSDNLPNYYTQLAICYEEDGETAKAIQAYKVAYKETKNKVLLYHLARNYDTLYKDKKVALTYYEKYLEEKDTANEYLMNYSKYRVQELKSASHFNADSF